MVTSAADFSSIIPPSFVQYFHSIWALSYRTFVTVETSTIYAHYVSSLTSYSLFSRRQLVL
jgi:hypothetical protein